MNQVLVEIETAKSLVELPSPFAGVVSALLVQEGETVEVGTPIITVDAVGGSETTAPSKPVVIDTVGDVAVAIEKEPANLVGYGVGGHGGTRRRRSTGAPEAVPTAVTAAAPASTTGVLAKPPIRKLAKDLGVDLANVLATGPIGEITRDDVLRQASQVKVFKNLQTPEWGTEREEIVPVKGMRKAIATAMVSSKFTAPHVSVFVDIDATRTMDFVKRLKTSPDFAGIRVSPLLIAAKAVIWAVRRNPMVNSTWSDKEISVHHYVNLGIAAATPRGLVVPNVKDAHTLSLRDLAQALEQLTITARDGKTPPADMAGGTFTITNLGSFGMTTGTPILNPGEVGILVLGAIKLKPWVVDGEVVPRMVTTLGGSFDHRVVDGDVVSRFVADVASVMEEPALLLD
jgi:pyruvate dehydrogenase E2 component (dihydrolipoamide acetyltransferase)